MKGAQIAQKERISIGLMHLPSFYSKDRSSEGRQHWDEYQLNSTQLNSLGLPKAGLKESWLWFHASISVVLVYSSASLHVVYCEHIASLEHDVVQYSFILFPRIVGGTVQ